MRKISISLMLMVLATPFALAQKTGDLGILGGTTYYLGELNPARPFRMAKPAFGIMYRQNLNSRVAIRLHGLRGKVAGDDAISKANIARNLNFESAITEVGLQLEINFFEYFIGSKKNRITPYIFGGASGFKFSPKATIGNITEPVNRELEGIQNVYKDFAFSVPFGIGVKYSVNKLIGVGAEWGMRKTSTDYLDNVSRTYVSPSPLAGMQRGNSRDTDWYSFAGASLTVKIRMLTKEKCLDHQREGY